VRRALTVLMGLLLPLVWVTPQAEANGAAVCAISGTIDFTPSTAVPSQGQWRIEPAVINCQGIYRGYQYFTAPGSFAGTGTYTDLPGKGGCLHQVGKGDLDYRLTTTEADLHFEEPGQFVLAGAGAFTTPSLNGTIQMTPPYEGDCLSAPVTRATFFAQALMVRLSGSGVDPGFP
jgi:hypothetical protein